MNENEVEKKKSYIILNLNSSKYIYVLLLPFSCMFIHFFQEIMIEKYDNKKESDNNKKDDDTNSDNNNYEILLYNLSFLTYYFLPKLLTIFLLIIIKYKNKNETSSDDKNKVLRRYHFSIEKENRKKILLLIYTISLLEVIYKADDSLLYYLRKKERIKILIEKRTGFIIFVPLFSFYILNKRLYKHHIFALILTFLGATIISITRFVLKFSDIGDIIFHLINIFFSSFFSLSLVLIKYILLKFILTPYNFLFYDGIFCLINTLLCPFFEYIFVLFIEEKNNNFKYYLNKNYQGLYQIFIGKEWLFYLSFFIAFIASFLYFIFNVLTIYNFSPYLNVLTDFLTPFLLNILTFIFFNDSDNAHKNSRFIWENVGYLIIFLGALILNEIIILNFCGFNENTYTNISNRGVLESTLFGELGPNEDNDDLEEPTEGAASNNS